MEQLETRAYSKELLQHLSTQKTLFGEVFRSKDDVVVEVGIIREKLLKHDDLIKKLETARNKYYAHSDGKAGINLPISEEYSVLSELCADIFNTIKGGFFDTHTKFDHTRDWSIDWLIQSASELRSKREKDLALKKG